MSQVFFYNENQSILHFSIIIKVKIISNDFLIFLVEVSVLAIIIAGILSIINGSSYLANKTDQGVLVHPFLLKEKCNNLLIKSSILYRNNSTIFHPPSILNSLGKIA